MSKDPLVDRIIWRKRGGIILLIIMGCFIAIAHSDFGGVVFKFHIDSESLDMKDRMAVTVISGLVFGTFAITFLIQSRNARKKWEKKYYNE